VNPKTRKLLKDAREQFAKDYGQESMTTLNSPENWSLVTDWLSTQSLALDYAIGRPGLPAGKITEIVGLPQTGKTLLGIHLLRETQKRGGIAVLIDTERGYDPLYARRLGLDTDDIQLLQPESLEDVFEWQEKLIKIIRKADEKSFVTMITDSIAATPTKQEIKEGHEKKNMAPHARQISYSFRKLLTLIARERIVIVYINQQKEKIGTFFQTHYSTLGGSAAEFTSSIRLELRYTGRLVDKSSKLPYGISIRVKVIKNRLAPPYREADVDLLFNGGIDIGHSALPVAVAVGVVVPKGGGWFMLGDEKLQLGKLKEKLSEPKLLERIREKAGLKWKT